MASPLFAADYSADIARSGQSAATSYWSNAAIWTVDGAPAANIPTLNDDVVVVGTVGSTTNSYLVLNPNGMTAYAKNLTMTNIFMSVFYDSAITDWSAAAPSLEVANNLTVNGASQLSLTNSQPYGGRGFAQIKIGGDMIVNSGTTLGFSAYKTYSDSYLALDVGGVLKLNGGDVINYSRYVQDSLTVNPYIRLGGLQGNGTNIIARGENRGAQTTIIFGNAAGKTFTGGTFSGTFQARDDNQATMTLQMNDTSGGGNKQTLKLQSGSLFQTFNVDVISGRMDVSTDSGAFVINNLNLKGGGTFGVAGSYAGADYGNVDVGTINWTSGTNLHFDLFKEGEDYFNDTITVGNNIVLDSLDPSGSLYNILFDFIGFTDVNEDQRFYIMLKNSGSFLGFDAGKLSGQTSDGRYEAVFYGSDSPAISVSFVQVPEPSTVAAILGALALAFAAYRRRK